MLQSHGGAERDRTAGLLVANEALSQLSYSPTTFLSYQQTAKLQRSSQATPMLKALKKYVSSRAAQTGKLRVRSPFPGESEAKPGIRMHGGTTEANSG